MEEMGELGYEWSVLRPLAVLREQSQTTPQAAAAKGIDVAC
jgi:hypothetical protein